MLVIEWGFYREFAFFGRGEIPPPGLALAGLSSQTGQQRGKAERAGNNSQDMMNIIIIIDHPHNNCFTMFPRTASPPWLGRESAALTSKEGRCDTSLPCMGGGSLFGVVPTDATVCSLVNNIIINFWCSSSAKCVYESDYPRFMKDAGDDAKVGTLMGGRFQHGKNVEQFYAWWPLRMGRAFFMRHITESCPSFQF